MNRYYSLFLVLLVFPVCAEASDLCSSSIQYEKNRLENSRDPEDGRIQRLAFGGLSPLKDLRAADKNTLAQVASLLAANADSRQLRTLLSNGFDPNSKVSGGAPMIVSAAECGNDAVVLALGDAGADIYATDRQGMSAMAASIINDSEAVANILLGFDYCLSRETVQSRAIVSRLAKKLHHGKYEAIIKHEKHDCSR